MKKYISPMNSSKIEKKYPIHNKLAGWFFRIEETSNGVYLVEGIDKTGVDSLNLTNTNI